MPKLSTGQEIGGWIAGTLITSLMMFFGLGVKSIGARGLVLLVAFLLIVVIMAKVHKTQSFLSFVAENRQFLHDPDSRPVLG